MNAVPVPILSSAKMARSFSAFPLEEIAAQYRPAMRILFLSNAAIRRTTASLLRRPDSLIKLLKWLTDAYDLQPDDILRHYDCGGKKCPIYIYGA